MNSKTIGILAVLCAALIWSIEPILAKFSYVNSSVLETLLVRSFVIALIGLIYLFITKGTVKVNKRQFSVLFYLAVAATIISEFIYLYALTKIPVVNVVIIGHTQPLYMALLTYFLLKEERLTKKDYIGISLMIGASLFVTTKTLANLFSLRLLTFWDLMVVIASILWASTGIAMKKYLKELNCGTIVFYRYGISAIFLTIYLLFVSKIGISNIFQVLLGLSVGVGVILYYESLKRLKATHVSSYELVTPFFAAILGFIFFREYVTIMQIIGIVMLILGARFLAKEN